jgi:hypothetical protein
LGDVGLSKKECLALLRSYNEQLQMILGKISDGARIRVEGIRVAQSLLKQFKDELRRAYDDRNTQAGRKRMSSFEEQYLFPAIHETTTRIRVRSNTRPNSAWIDQLYDAELTISYWIDQMEASGN